MSQDRAASLSLGILPDKNGCYGWPRTCAHHDDLDCYLAEQADDQAFQRYWRRVQQPDHRSKYPVAVKVSRRQRGWRRASR